ncbi:MAG: FHA domain-containing protein [Verrucomicrobiota bacterium]
MNLKLVLQSQAKCGTKEYNLSENSCSIGRKQDNELIIEEFCVSGYHAKVYQTSEGDYEVTDLDSSEGTFLNRKRVSSPAKIRPGDVLKFGIIKMAVEELKEGLPSMTDPPEPGDGIIRFDEIPLIEDLDPGHHEIKEQENEPPGIEAIEELRAAKDAAEEEVRKLREELSRVREESRRKNTDDESELSSLINDLEFSLDAEKLLTDAVKGKNEEFRSKIELLTTDLGHAQEELRRLKAKNVRQLPVPEDDATKFAKLKQELVLSHDDNANLQGELTDLQLELATLRGEATNREIELLEKEQCEARTESTREKQLLRKIADLEGKLAESGQIEVSRPLEELERRLEASEKAARSAVQREADLKETNTGLSERLKEAEGKIASLEAQKEERVSSHSPNAIEIEELKEKLTLAETEVQQVRQEFEASQEERSDMDVLLSAKSNLATEQAAEIKELRKELTDTKKSSITSEKNLVKTHRGELEALRKELKASCKESNQWKERLESLQSDFDSLRDDTVEERARETRDQEAKLTRLEEDLAESVELRSEFESAQDELKETLRKRDERIAVLIELKSDLESKLESAEEEKSEIQSLLRFTREGLSGALHSARTVMVRTTRELESEIVRRVKLENLFQKSEEARKGLRSEIEALEAESDEEVVLSPEDSSFPRSSRLTETQEEELRAFEERMASLRPGQRWDQNSDVAETGGFGEVEFYRQLVGKLDLVDELIKLHERKRRFAKIVEQLILLKDSFLELLENQSVDLLDLAPGTPLCMNQTVRLELVPLADGSEPKIDPFGNTEVVETVCPGYIFHDGSRDLVIRKARVKVG